jgi:hypothetical protein
VGVAAISPTLDAHLARLEAIRERDCLYVFSTRDNKHYADSGFKTMWHRCVLETIQQNILTRGKRFTFQELHAFYATKHKKVTGALSDLHKNKDTTAKAYDRSTEVFETANRAAFPVVGNLMI